MSCPFFYASEPLSPVRELRPVPLGRFHRGECRVSDAHIQAHIPDDNELRAWCNFGYARGECPHFPAAATADAVRFSIAYADAAIITVRYCFERDHHPVQHGLLTFHCATGRLDPPHADTTVNRLAEAYLESYLARRKS